MHDPLIQGMQDIVDKYLTASQKLELRRFQQAKQFNRSLLMLVKNQQGCEIEIRVYGSQDDIQILEAYNVDTNTDATDEDVAWIERNYAEAISIELIEAATARAEDQYDLLSDR